MGRARKIHQDLALICHCSPCPIYLQSREEGDDLWSRSLSGEKRGFYFYERQSAILPRHSCPNCVVCLSAAAAIRSVLSSKWGEEPKTFLSVKAVTVGQAMAAKAAARFHTFIWREQTAAAGGCIHFCHVGLDRRMEGRQR